MRSNIVGIIGALLIVGCGANQLESARARHAKQFRCAPPLVTAEKLQGNIVLVDGCGVHATYNCAPIAAGDSTCTMESVEQNGKVGIPK